LHWFTLFTSRAKRESGENPELTRSGKGEQSGIGTLLAFSLFQNNTDYHQICLKALL